MEDNRYTCPECGYTSCISRGCGDCTWCVDGIQHAPDCNGVEEHTFDSDDYALAKERWEYHNVAEFLDDNGIPYKNTNFEKKELVDGKVVVTKPYANIEQK
jgi:hypothetical protein